MIKLCSQVVILLALTILTNIASAAPMMALIDDEHTKVDIGEVGSYYIDESGTLSLRDIDSEPLRKRFIPLNQSFLQFGLVKGNVWIRVDVAQRLSSTQSAVLHIKAPRIQELDVYTPTLTYNQIYKEMGESRPFNNRPIAYPDYIIPFPANVPPVFTLYIKASSHLPINLLAQVKTLSALEQDVQKDTSATGLFAGILLLLLACSTFFFIKTKQFMYVSYGALILGSIGVHLSLHGWIYQIFPDITGLQEKFYNFSALVCIVSVTFFSRLFLDTKEHFPKFDKVLLTIGLVNASLSVPFAVVPEDLSITLLTFSAFITTIVLLVLSIYALYVQAPLSNYYFLSRIIVTAGHGMWILSAYNIFPIPFWYEWGLSIAVVLEVIVNFIGMTARPIHQLNNQNKNDTAEADHNELLDEISARIKLQTSIIKHHQKKTGHASQEAIEKAQANLSHLAERLTILHQMRAGKLAQSYTPVNLQTLIEQAYSNFTMLDQDEAEVELSHDDIAYWEITSNGSIINHLYQSVMEELKHYTDQSLTIESTVNSNERDGNRELRIMVHPIPSSIELNGNNRLGVRYLEDLTTYLDGSTSLTGEGRNRTMTFAIPISARLIEPSELALRTHSDDLKLIIVGKDSELIEHTITHLHAQLFNLSHFDQLSELYHMLQDRSFQSHFAIMLFEDQQNFGASDLASFNNELRDTDICLLVSNNVKMSQEYASALGFDGFIYSNHIESKLVPELERLQKDIRPSSLLPKINRSRQHA